MHRVVAGSSVTKTEVKVAIRTKLKISTLVSIEGLLDPRIPVRPTEVETTVRVRSEGIVRRTDEPRYHAVAIDIDEADEQAATRRVVGRERHAQQPQLAATGDF